MAKDAVAKFVEGLPARVRNGEFSAGAGEAVERSFPHSVSSLGIAVRRTASLSLYHDLSNVIARSAATKRPSIRYAAPWIASLRSQ